MWKSALWGPEYWSTIMISSAPSTVAKVLVILEGQAMMTVLNKYQVLLSFLLLLSPRIYNAARTPIPRSRLTRPLYFDIITLPPMLCSHRGNFLKNICCLAFHGLLMIVMRGARCPTWIAGIDRAFLFGNVRRLHWLSPRLRYIPLVRGHTGVSGLSLIAHPEFTINL